MDTKAQVLRLIQEQMPQVSQETPMDADLVSDLGADSLDIVHIALSLENHFNFNLCAAEVPDRFKLGKIVAQIEELEHE